MLKRKSALAKEIFKKGNKTGSIYPSSRFLCRKMISTIDFDKARCIVELGPGEGVITRRIIEKMGPNTQLFCFEMNPVFVEEHLQFNDPRIHVITDSAEHIGKHLAEHGITEVDYIISSLPLTILPPEVKEKIIEESRRLLRSKGIYMQYQYMTTVAKLLRSKFKKVKIGFVPFNIPPAFVYTCHN
jgi:phosphatidylethanolamine/phosphatidyl-N-methylethanolamine N-methyltransferase